MKKIFYCFLILFLNLFSFILLANEDEKTNVKQELVWNKWDTDNFIILSLDKNQGLFVKDNIELIKNSVCENFGIENINFPIKTKLMCVPNKDFLKKLFNIDHSHFEVRFENEQPNVSAIWISFDDFQSADSFVLANCLSDSFYKNNQKCFIQRGVFYILNNSVEKLKEEIVKIEELNSNKLFSVKQKDWISFSKEEKNKFDRESFLLCLLLRKEFGKNIFGKFLQTDQDENSFEKVYGFSGFDDFDLTLERYLKNISNDIKNNKMPDKYLKVK